MPNQYNPAKRTIGELLSLTNPPILVPEWQRNYSWTSSEADTFWQDIILFDQQYPGNNITEQEYFIGSIVLVDNGNSHLLLDGQQRLATSAILLSVIRDYLLRYNQDASTRITTRYLTDFDDATNRTIYKLSLNVYDRDFYKREVLEPRTAAYESLSPTIQSHRLIREVRSYFDRVFEERYNELANPQLAHNWALRILTVLTGHVSVVAISSTDEDNAASVFETLNDRGIGLSTPDLLRNLILRRAQEDQREEIVDCWRDVYELNDEVKVDLFLRHYWISKEGDVKTRSLFRQIKSIILSRDTSSIAFSRELSQSTDNYRLLVTANTDNEDLSYALQNLRDLGATLFYPLLLSAYSCGNPDMLLTLIRLLVVLYVRYNIVGRRDNSQLETIIYSAAKELRESSQFEPILERIKAFAPNDDLFRRQFEQIIVSRKESARYLLKEIEKYMRGTTELEVASSRRVHIEHIYPQTPLDGQRLPNHSEYINRLGNLTLLDFRINAAIKNGSFEDKRLSYERSELKLTLELLAEETWNAEAIERRQQRLAEMAPIIWPIS